ncbi:MAG: M28 family peptidase [Acidobacteria bacterium]|nr:M28 family peptidase [Acidobacteriota bacterium]MBV9475221.1 M28 family peptidase [Acidobacteriota bacterium]
MLRIAALLLLAIPLAAQPIPPSIDTAFHAFRGDAVRAHLKFLASDLLEGRGPGTRGDALATSYIAAQFEAMGLQPAGDGGTYFQKVSLLNIAMDAAKSRAAFTKNGAAVLGPLVYRDQFVGGNQSQQENVSIDSDVVFVGHGVVAPEYRWDDYKGLDTRGKTLVMLVDDPPASAQEPDLFRGRARTYYGRWTYKYEIGAAKGAAAVILIHTDPAAGYGWQVVRNSWGGEQAYVKLQPGQPGLQFAGWITEAIAKQLFQTAGLDLDKLTQAAASRDFKPVPLNVRFNANVASTIRPFDTANVVAKLEGSDPVLKDEGVVYSAHHDHLGIGPADPSDPNDTIYNGAIDNASGVATLLEIARVWSTNPVPHKRTLYFAAVAAEEQGLLGSQFLGQHPPIPAGKIAMGLNFDALDLFGPVGSVTMIGIDHTTFFPTAKKVTDALGLTIVPDQAPEQGSYYRSDHFSLAKAGIPAFSVKQGLDVRGKPESWGREHVAEYRTKHYHQASDEYDPSWDFSSAVQIGQLAYWLGAEAANAAEKPMWLPGEEFYDVTARARR